MPHDDFQVVNGALLDVQRHLLDHGKTLADYPPMPVPQEEIAGIMQQPRIIAEECSYDTALQQAQIDSALPQVNDGQMAVFQQVST